MSAATGGVLRLVDAALGALPGEGMPGHDHVDAFLVGRRREGEAPLDTGARGLDDAEVTEVRRT